MAQAYRKAPLSITGSPPGVGLIAMGAGGIKLCVSAHWGDPFGTRNQQLLERVFSWFYFFINPGGVTSTLRSPLRLFHYGPRWAFGVPGVRMLPATWVFWPGRRRFTHISPGRRRFVRETFNRENLSTVFRLSFLYIFVTIFWSLDNQTGSA